VTPRNRHLRPVSGCVRTTGWSTGGFASRWRRRTS
jgi:hypothetical protein